MKPALFLLSLFATFSGLAQTDTIPENLVTEDLLESYLQDQGNDIDFDYNDLFEELETFLGNPIDINQVTDDELELFQFLSPLQKSAFREYLADHGPLLSIYELQAIPHFDLATIKYLLPFVKLDPSRAEPLSKTLGASGRSQLLLRWSGTVQQKRGFLKDEFGNSRYAGDRNAIYLRYRYSISNKVSIGFTAEKDEGETFFRQDNKQGFDFYSAHFFMQNLSGRIKSVALGDYSISMGQGLVLFNGFSIRKSPLSLSIKRSGRALKKYSSVNEADFYRGAAATISLTDQLDLTAFVSSKRRDANLDEPDDLPDDAPSSGFVTSLQATGKHRTEAEIADENAIRQNALGGILKWENRRSAIAFNLLYNSLGKPLDRNPSLYDQFYFGGKKLLNASIDYSRTWRNYHFFGETAISDNGSVATINGLLVSLDPKMDIAVLYRNFPKNYQALNAQPFAETSGGRNETGTYLGVEFRPSNKWKVNGYFDQWKHQWLRFRTDSPSVGHEWLLRVTYSQRKKMEAHIQLRNEVKSENFDSPDGRFDQIFPVQNFQGRIHLSYKLNKNLEWRSRFYAGFSKQNENRFDGMAFYQDLKYKSLGIPVSFSARFVIFDTDDYDIRFYAYENDVLNSFSVPAYYDRGSRYYILVAYRTRAGITLEGRLARTYFTNRENAGSGNDEIAGPAKTDIKMQLRWNF